MRNTLLGRLPLVLFLVLVLGTLPAPTITLAESGSVPMFRGGPARTGENPGPGPAGKPIVRWRAGIGEMIGSSPAVVDGVVYVGSISPTTLEGGALHAVDAA